MSEESWTPFPMNVYLRNEQELAEFVRKYAAGVRQAAKFVPSGAAAEGKMQGNGKTPAGVPGTQGAEAGRAAAQRLLADPSMRSIMENLKDGDGVRGTSDTERLEWLMHNISGAESRRLGIMTSAGVNRENLDAARGVDAADELSQFNEWADKQNFVERNSMCDERGAAWDAWQERAAPGVRGDAPTVFDELIAFEETCEVKPTFADAIRIALAAKKRTSGMGGNPPMPSKSPHAGVPVGGEDKWAMLARTGHLSPEVADAARDVAAGVRVDADRPAWNHYGGSTSGVEPSDNYGVQEPPAPCPNLGRCTYPNCSHFLDVTSAAGVSEPRHETFQQGDADASNPPRD